MPDIRSLESALDTTEAAAAAALPPARRLQAAVKAAQKAAKVGDLAALRRALANAEEAIGDAAEAVGSLDESWPFSEQDERDYLDSEDFRRELLDAAEAEGLAAFDRDEVIASYPSLVRVVARQRGVSIDRKAHRQIRPSELVLHLKARQTKEPNLKAAAFLNTLHQAYQLVADDPGVMVRLIDLHAALTLLPAARRDYGRQEFARDIYLLDRSGETTTTSGASMRLSSGATSARDQKNLLIVVTRDGVEKSYFGVEFVERGS